MDYEMKELVACCKEGHLKAKEEILRRLTPLVLASIRRYYFGTEDPEDLLQEGYLKILMETERFDGERGVPFLGYMKQQLKFFYMDLGRQKRQDISLDAYVDHGEERIRLLDLLPADDTAVEEKILQREISHSLGQALKKLTHKQKRIIGLHFIQGIKLARIAQDLGVHYQTVVKVKDAAIRKLRGLL
ncbi:sigma-70 family RNA polymerase sigma factor [Thermotalea metallivorans]|uniref:ECF RNA polymerase sigma factor SigW n=1 Tax=Thermotalea metallivorans TaxID=520762 RepID=A0A140L6Z8_9FIRM|nr:sigma-70 family RNA polymerase sigma factor [Thermotalea metallivorans]KXG76323.1 ECF RNA polymerase sigma factor SigW [Thermotalea metallivorans]